MPYIEVRPNIITFQDTFDAGTMQKCGARTALVTCIALPDGLIFVDSGAFVQKTAKFRTDMEKKFKKSTLYLFLTHAHWDHIFGMGAFLDVDIVASSKSNINIRRRLKNMDDPSYLKKYIDRYINTDPELAKNLKEVQLKSPALLVRDSYEFISEDEIITFNVVGGHTGGSSYIHVLNEDVICAGDNLVTCYAQVIGDAAQMLNIYEKWIDLSPNAIIPGHGSVVGIEYLQKVRNYFESLCVEVDVLKRKLFSFNEVLKSPQIPDYFESKSDKWVEGGKYFTKQIERTIKQIYKTV